MPDPDSATLWRRLAQEAGVAPDGFVVAREWRNRTAQRDQVVRRMARGDVALIFKHVRRPSDPAPFLTALTAQMHAAEVMTGPDSAPEVLAADPEARACVMVCVPGRNLHDMLSDGGAQAPILARAGGWIHAFHSATFAERRIFQPRFMRDHLRHLVRQIAGQEIAVAKPRAFVRHAARVIDMADAYEGRETRSARTHGDMNLRNILLDGDRAWGLDFTAAHNAPVGFDIARFLLHHAALFGDPPPEGQVVRKEVLSAFFDGYTGVGADDPSVQYLLRVRLLMDWAAIPADSAAQTGPQARRLRRLARLARSALV